ncbi:MAG: putative porin [Bacteroidota bacterium]
MALLLGASAYGQNADSLTVAPADSIAVVSDSLSVVPDSMVVALPDSVPPIVPVPFRSAERGRQLAMARPAREPAFMLQRLLTDHLGGYRYRFGAYGWPEGWSPEGLAPQHVQLAFNGLPFDEPVTGRPLYAFLPTTFSEALRVEPSRQGAPLTVLSDALPFDVGEPTTEIRYASGADGMQTITALHTQRRRVQFFGQPALLGVLFSYGGHTSDGAYSGSGLTQGRQTYFRVRYARPRWTLEVANLNNRSRLGAQGGVTGTNIYQTLGASTRNASATRRTIRNDTYATLRLRSPFFAEPLTATAYRTQGYLRYLNPDTETLRVETVRWGGFATQEVTLGSHALQLRAEGWVDGVRDFAFSGDAQSTAGGTLPTLVVSVYDSLRVAEGWHVTGSAGAYATAEGALPIGHLRTTWATERRTVFAEGRLTTLPLSRMDVDGFGTAATPLADADLPWLQQVNGGIEQALGVWSVEVDGFIRNTLRATDLFATAREDTMEVLALGDALVQAGGTLRLGWRADAEAGFYGHAEGSITRVLNPSASVLHARMQEAQPLAHGSVTLGLRALLFKGDLGLDLFARTYAWSSSRSRIFHPHTGLLAIPTADAGRLGGSATLDVYATAGIRTATLFIAYENVLARTTFFPGTFNVPTYPFQARAFRLGVFWPFTN